jgi:hypothetical protein
MEFAPKRDWKFYEQSVASTLAERAVTLTLEERFEIYADYFDTIRHAKMGTMDQAAVERARWREDHRIFKISMVS